MTRIGTFLRTNGLALVALFFALSGTAVAAGGLITGDKIAPSTLTGAHVKDGTLDGWDLANNAVATYKIADGSISSPDIGSLQIKGNHIDKGSIPLSKLSVKEGAWASITLPANTCKSVAHGGFVPGSPTYTVATTALSDLTVSSTVADASGYAQVTLCNHLSIQRATGIRVYAFQP